MSSLTRLVADMRSRVPKWAGGTQAPKPVVWLACDDLIASTRKNYPKNPEVVRDVIKLLAGENYVTDADWNCVILDATKHLEMPDMFYDAGIAFPPLSADRAHARSLHFF